MRGLTDSFSNNLKTGFLSGITDLVKGDPDLVLEIRDSYINIYYKGHSLLKLTETSTLRYSVEIHKKFLEEINLPRNFTENNVAQFLNAIPLLKRNIVRHGKRSLEIEYEQMIIRANNFEARNNTDYLIVDKQYAVGDGRFDLIGIYWNRNHRRPNQEVPICLMEIKFALNTDIKEAHHQLARYYEAIRSCAAELAEEMQIVFQQKVDLGLYQLSPQQLEVLKTVSFSNRIEQFQFILILVDYNPNSCSLDLQSLSNLPFANQVKVFRSGFAMWQQDMKSVSTHLS